MKQANDLRAWLLSRAHRRRVFARWSQRLVVLLTGFAWLIVRPSPSVAGVDAQLQITLETGNDDLRGGNDNVSAVLVLASGATRRFERINEGKSWPAQSSSVVVRGVSSSELDQAVAIRLETTFSGGIGGDNWDLKRLQVTSTNAGRSRRLFDSAGSPLFRFTGNDRVREFRFSGAPPAMPAGAVMTGFRPPTHGFHFVNSFTNIFISEVDWTTRGLCGGMAYAALDYFFAPKPVPAQNYRPAEGMPLQSYLYNRQTESIVRNVDKWAEYGFNPGGSRNREFFDWGLQMGSGRLGELRARIDSGKPVPLGLQECGADCGCPGGCPGSHQVVAIGYQLGRYTGDRATHPEDVSLFIYDPNFPERVMTLKPNLAGAMYGYVEDARSRWRAYFVDTKYAPRMPPTIADHPSELLVTFSTGGDDLRGGNDNVHLSVALKSGQTLRFENVNGGRRWVNNSTQQVTRELPTSLLATDIVSVRLQTTFGGGLGGDNWNLDALEIALRKEGRVQVLRRFQGPTGKPLFRFTGSEREKQFSM